MGGETRWRARSRSHGWSRGEWQALYDELILFPNAEHDDLFDALETMVEGAMVPRATVELIY